MPVAGSRNDGIEVFSQGCEFRIFTSMARMQTFPVALGVESQGGCNFCHEADRSLDTKPAKVKARQMIELVTEINAKFGDGKVHVTCWTCHQGSTTPEIARTPKP